MTGRQGKKCPNFLVDMKSNEHADVQMIFLTDKITNEPLKKQPKPTKSFYFWKQF